MTFKVAIVYREQIIINTTNIIYNVSINVFLQSSEHLHLDLCIPHNQSPNIRIYMMLKTPYNAKKYPLSKLGNATLENANIVFIIMAYLINSCFQSREHSHLLFSK